MFDDLCETGGEGAWDKIQYTPWSLRRAETEWLSTYLISRKYPPYCNDDIVTTWIPKS